jgi:predicted amidohydrolase YtcJ
MRWPTAFVANDCRPQAPAYNRAVRTLYRASRVHTFSLPPEGEWVLIDGRHVERVGSGDPPAADRVVELPGSTIVPGMIDTHVHLTGTGVHLAHPQIARARSAAELTSTLREICAGRDAPTLVHGFDESTWDDPRLPSMPELDAVTRQALVVVRVDGHLSLGNRPAVQSAGVLDALGAEALREGGPAAVVTLEANARLKRWVSSQLGDGEVQELQLDAAASAASRGVTCVHEMSMPAERGLRDLEVLMRHRDRLPVDVVTYVATTDIPQVMDLGLPRIGGDLPVDGSIGAHTAALQAPYEDRRDTSGTLAFTGDELVEFVHGGHAAGLQVGVHAIGDRAIDQVLTTWERVYGTLDSRERRHFRARRHRIEHFEMASQVQIERAGMLGLALSFQPAFDSAWGAAEGMYERRLGPERAAAMNPIRSCFERGIVVGVGSDSPITALDPMAGISALESHHDPAQRLSRTEALHLSTYGGARLAHQEDKKGALVPGMHADFAAYEVDPTNEPDIRRARPVLTISLGREVFAA